MCPSHSQLISMEHSEKCSLMGKMGKEKRNQYFHALTRTPFGETIVPAGHPSISKTQMYAMFIACARCQDEFFRLKRLLQLIDTLPKERRQEDVPVLSCHEARGDFPAFMDQTIPEGEDHELRKHLRECRSCFEEFLRGFECDPPGRKIWED